MSEVKTNHIYRHFKGKYYYVKEIVSDSETLENIVIYNALYDDYKTFSRKESMFIEEVGTRSDNITNQKYRFELIEMENEIK